MPKAAPNIEITLQELLTSYDWAQVFADENAGNVSKTIHVAPPGADVSDGPMSRTDVKKILAAVNGENDGAEWLGVFKLKDGRFLVASGGCDYTGWDCQAGNCLIVCNSLKNVRAFGLTTEQRTRLGL